MVTMTYQTAVTMAEQLIQQAAEHPDIHQRVVYLLEVFQRASKSEFFQPDLKGFTSALKDYERQLKKREKKK